MLNKDNRIKAYNNYMKNTNNYELDSSGQWNRKSSKSSKTIYKAKNKYNHTLTLGKIGELATAQKFLNHGYEVFVPLVDISGTDMIVEKDDGPKKIQVKSSSTISDDGNSILFSLKSNNFNTKNGSIVSYKKKYKKRNVDYFALYNADDNDVYLVENNEDKASITIRKKLSETNLTTKGKNLEKLNMVDDYQIDKVLDDIDQGLNQSNIIEVVDFIDKTDIN